MPTCAAENILINLWIGLFMSAAVSHLKETRKKRSFPNNIDCTPFSFEPTITLREEATERLFVLILRKLRKRRPDSAALHHSKLQFFASSYCHGYKAPFPSDSRMKPSISINYTGILVLHKIVVYSSFHVSGKSRFDTVMTQKDRVCRRRSAAWRQIHEDTISVWLAKVISFARFIIHDEDQMKISSSSERSANLREVAYVQYYEIQDSTKLSIDRIDDALRWARLRWHRTEEEAGKQSASKHSGWVPVESIVRRAHIVRAKIHIRIPIQDVGEGKNLTSCVTGSTIRALKYSTWTNFSISARNLQIEKQPASLKQLGKSAWGETR